MNSFSTSGMKIKTNVSRANSINNYAITDFCNNIDECDEYLAGKLEMFHEDMTSWLPFGKRLRRFADYINQKIWTYIVTVAIQAACTGATQDYIGGKLSGMRLAWTKEYRATNDFLGFTVYYLSMVMFALFATAILNYVSPIAAGSGVPQIKTVLSGVPVYKFLHWKLLLAKYFAQLGSQSSGVGTGKEGPMIHMSSMIAYNLGYLPFFRTIMQNPFYKRTLQTTSVACGVTSTFGAPYGAIVFSIELCTTVFLLSNLWKLYVTATIVKVCFDTFKRLNIVTSISSNYEFDQNTVFTNLPWYIVLGFICGYAGSLWIYMFSVFNQFRAQVPIAIIKNRWFQIVFLSLAISLLTYWLPTTYKGNKGLLNSMWDYDDIFLSDKNTFNGISTLCLTFICRFFMIMFYASMPLPSGISLPSIVQGAMIGRAFGELLRYFYPQAQAQSFSIVGAAAFAGVMTRATSVTLLILEITGQNNLIMGIMCANLCSYAIANLFTMSQFNTALTLSKMPYLPFMFYSSLYKKKIGEFMEAQEENFELDNCYLIDILEYYGNKQYYFNDEFVPIVENSESMLIEGSVRAFDILEYVMKIAEALTEETKKGNTSELVRKFTTKLRRINREENADDVSQEKIFMKIPHNLVKWLKNLRRHEAKLDFGGAGISVQQGRGDTSGFEELFLNSIRKVRDRAQEKAAGNPPDPNRIIDEYYLFTKLVLHKMKVEWRHPIVRFNSHPICVDADTKLVKVHYLFQMLGVNLIFVTKRGKITGKVLLEKFLNLRYTQQTYIQIKNFIR